MKNEMLKNIYESTMYQGYLINLVEKFLIDADFHPSGSYYLYWDTVNNNIEGPSKAIVNAFYDGKYFFRIRPHKEFSVEMEEEGKNANEIAVNMAYEDVLRRMNGGTGLFDQLIVEKTDQGLYFSLDLNKLYKGQKLYIKPEENSEEPISSIKLSNQKSLLL
jgi:hypothetical protein